MENEMLERAKEFKSPRGHSKNQCVFCMAEFAASEVATAVARRESEIIAAVDEIDEWAKHPDYFHEEICNYFQGLKAKAGREE